MSGQQVIPPGVWTRITGTDIEVIHVADHNVTVTVRATDPYPYLPSDAGGWRVRVARGPFSQDDSQRYSLMRQSLAVETGNLPALLFLDTDGTLVELAAPQSGFPAIGDRRRAMIGALLNVALERLGSDEHAKED